MAFKSIAEVQAERDKLGPDEFERRRASGVYGEANLRMIDAWERHAAATDAVAEAARSERGVTATESQAKSARWALGISIVSVAISVVALLVAIAALFKPSA